jgi:hypothetical protein
MTISLTLYKKIQDNKEFIIKNFYYRKEVEVEFELSNQYKNFVNKLETNNREIVPEINKKSKLDSINNILFKKLIILFNEINLKNLDILICYTPKIQLDTMTSIKRDKLLNDYEKIYDEIPEVFDNFLKGNSKKIKEDFNELLIEIAKDNVLDCKSFDTIIISIGKFIKKIKGRSMSYGKYDKEWFFIIYNDIIYYITPTKDKKNIKLCINNTFTKDESEWFIEFSETSYSPIFDAMKDLKNLPEPTYLNTELSRRKSITKLSDITFNKEPKKLGKYTEKEYFDKRNLYEEDSILWNNKDKHLEYQIHEVMQCFRNDKYTQVDIDKAKKSGFTKAEINKQFYTKTGYLKQIFGPSDANYRREPFIKQILNFPHIFDNKTSNKGGKILKCDLELVKKIRFELNNILDLIKIKYPPKKNKEYFLIDLAGGASKHFDYSLYSFTKEELNEPQDTFLVKKNLWKKLEFKSNGKAINISGLSNYLSKSPITLFDTVNKTFGNEFLEYTQNIIPYKKWLKQHINYNEYFTKAVENILQGQKDKIYIIWNVEAKKIYLDNFLDNELKINRINDKPQIYLDEELLNKGQIRIIIQTGESEQWIDYKKSNKKSKIEEDEYEEEIQEDVEINGKKFTSGGFKFHLKRNKTAFFNDKKFQNNLAKLDMFQDESGKLDIENSNYF